MKKSILCMMLAIFIFISTACNESSKTPIDSNIDTPQETNQSTPQDMPNKEDDFLPLEIQESGYAMNGEYLYYAIILYNPNPTKCVEFPSFRISARDADGLLLGTEEQTLSVIYPQQQFCFASQAFKVDESPATVEFSAIEPDEYNIINVDLMEHPVFEPLEPTNYVLRENRVLGEILNHNDYDIDDAVVTIIFRDNAGNIVAGDSTYVSKIPASESIPFDCDSQKDFSTDSFEVYSNIW